MWEGPNDYFNCNDAMISLYLNCNSESLKLYDFKKFCSINIAHFLQQMHVKVFKVMQIALSSWQVSIGDQGILSTTCECSRGAPKCSHATALAIFAVHNIGCMDV
jgi:hypothetical protein